MLEAAIALQLALGDYTEAAIIGGLAELVRTAHVVSSQQGRAADAAVCGCLRWTRRRRWTCCAPTRRLHRPRPDVLIAVMLSVGGIAMTPLPALVVAGTLAAAAAFAFVLDPVKAPVFAHLESG